MPGGGAPYRVEFEALVAGGAPLQSLHWDFGDGGSSTQRDPTHSYSQAGGWLAILTVTDELAPFGVCRDSIPIYVGVVVDPLCGAWADIRWGDAPLAVRFQAYPGLVGDPPPYTWSWRFGDGATGAQPSPAHTYMAPGTYYAVATLHTSLRSYDCYPTLRVSALEPEVVAVGPSAGEPGLRLDAPRPNPFGALSAVGFVVPRAGRVRLAIRDLEGRTVATLVDGYRPAGRDMAVWMGRTDAGGSASPGLYFVSLEHEGAVRTAKLVRR